MKRIKKITFVVFAMVMAMALITGCGDKKDSASEIVGTWKVSSVETAGVSVDFEEYAKSLGQSADSVVMEIEVKEDNTFSINIMGQKTDGTWEEKNDKYIMTLGGADQEITIKDGKMSFEEKASGTIMNFEKE